MRSIIVLPVAALVAASLSAQDSPRDAFEARVRPLLAERCHSCHGPNKQKSDLRLDHGDFVRRGGERGPAVVPGKPEASRIMEVVGYQNVDLQMPPKGKLSEGEIEILRSWIADGAYWPDEPQPSAAAKTEKKFDLDARRSSHWCWQPLRTDPPPSTAEAAWNGSAIDRFVADRLRREDLTPNPAADRRTWLRRVTMDLIGLPPTPEDVDAFEGDAREDADAKAAVVDRLLASPHFGERWARHWMDLFRYAETMGHEFDFQIHEAWRYRDYLIRALNEDLPYDRLIHEHVAGDLLPDARRDPESGINLSAIGTCSWWFMDQTHSPVDSYQHQSDRIDNAIDVVTKTFLGLTVSCARCHDHKFDAISTADYYALYGVVRSSRHVNKVLDAPNPTALAKAHDASVALGSALAQQLEGSAASTAAYLQAASVAPPRPAPPKDKKEREAGEAAWREELHKLAFDAGLDAGLLERWVDALARPELQRDAHHPMHAWSKLAMHGERVDPSAHWATATRAQRAAGTSEDAIDFADFRTQDFETTAWSTDGPAFGGAPSESSNGARARGDRMRLDDLPGRWAHSGRTALRTMGTLFSPEFKIEKRYVHVLVAGESARFNVVLNSFNIIRDPIYGRLKQNVDHADPRWRTIDLNMWRGEQAYLQFVDMNVSDPSGRGYAEDGWIAVQRVVFSDHGAPREAIAPLTELLGNAAPASLAEAARRYGGAVRRASKAWQERRATRHQLALLQWLLDHRLLPETAVSAPLTAWREADRAYPRPTILQAMQDGPGLDEPIHIRGGHRTPGRAEPRHFLTALGGRPLNQSAGSGRLALARSITSPDNPLTPRVAVNRIWHHLMGRGLVPTVDNFGVLGQTPSHPELLDWLGRQFVADGWSLKKTIRRIVLTETYGMSSILDPKDEARDPDNVFLHRMSIKRMQGEIIRDAMLAISGRLDRKLYGRSVPVHLTRFMEGRGRPGRSGPSDGAGRRSIYLEVRRNFLNPMFLAWDTPIPFSTVGRRAVSNVPAQALNLLNDPFVHQQAELWAKRILSQPTSTADRVERMYREALGRRPSEDEQSAAAVFIEQQTAAYGADATRAWKDLAHVLFNVKDFVFVE